MTAILSQVITPHMTDTPVIFDRAAVKRQRNRAAKTLPQADFLFREVADRVADRLSDINRTFPVAADIGSHGGILRQMLAGRGGIETLIETDFSEAQAGLSQNGYSIVADEEHLPLCTGSFDVVLSSLALHWVNDLPGTLIQINQALKPDGLFVGALFGLGTLKELRSCLMTAESDITGGMSARVSPFAEVRDMGGLLQRAGFALPVVDADMINVSYGNPLNLLKDLRHMGEGNALMGRGRPLRRDVLMRAMQLYVEQYGDQNGRVPATFEIIYLHGWHPAANQQKPLAPGSGKMSLGKILE